MATPDTWSEVAECLGVSAVAAAEFLRAWRPKAARKVDAVEEAIEDLEEGASSSVDAVKVVVSFGAPTRRAAADGFWETPKGIPGFDAEIRLIDPERGGVTEMSRS